MTTAEVFVPEHASPVERCEDSLLQALLDRIAEGRMRKAEREIAAYLQRCGRKLPSCPPR
jgi:hypothetical protein